MKNIFNSLFWKLSLFFALSLMLFGSVYIYVTYKSSLQYSQETSQRLNWDLAKRVAKFTKPFLEGNLNEVEVEELFHNVMVINPSVEVYLLNIEGKILSYYAPFGEVKLKKVNLLPINQFINNELKFLKGEDPRNPGLYKVFSAAEIIDEGNRVGYLYIILASEEYTSVSEMLADSFKLDVAVKSVAITLLSTLMVGLIVIWFLTKNVNRIIRSVNDFRKGNLKARINLKSQGEISTLANNIDAMADTIVKNLEEIKSVENLRKELIANISHDLRTPLTSIHGYAETLVLLEDNLKKEEKIKYANIILNSTNKVKKLVDDLFEISKLESNHIKTKKEYFLLNEIVSDVISKFDLIAKSKSIILTHNIQKKDITIYGDISLIERVFQNLLDNAIKHTQEGEKIEILITEKNSNFVEVCIKDTGVGIPPEELPFIFDRYKKINSTAKEGTGLGLAIVKKILEIHKVNISVESTLKKGTSFYFDLPIAQ